MGRPLAQVPLHQGTLLRPPHSCKTERIASLPPFNIPAFLLSACAPKGVVFMTFWQGFVISLSAQAGFVDAASAASAQDFLICIEMLIASLAHFYIFPTSQWQPGYRERRMRAAAADEEAELRLTSTFAVSDFFHDIQVLSSCNQRQFVCENYQFAHDPPIFCVHY